MHCPDCGTEMRPHGYAPDKIRRRFRCFSCGRNKFENPIKHHGPASGTDWRKKLAESYRNSDKVGHKVEMVCDGCGIKFWEYPKRRPKKTKYCTRECSLRNQRNADRATEIGQIDVEMTGSPKKPAPGETVYLVNDESGKRLENR